MNVRFPMYVPEEYAEMWKDPLSKFYFNLRRYQQITYYILFSLPATGECLRLNKSKER